MPDPTADARRENPATNSVLFSHMGLSDEGIKERTASDGKRYGPNACVFPQFGLKPLFSIW